MCPATPPLTHCSTRSCEANRKLARKELALRLDEHYNGPASKRAIAHAQATKSAARSHQRAAAKHAAIADERESQRAAAEAKEAAEAAELQRLKLAAMRGRPSRGSADGRMVSAAAAPSHEASGSAGSRTGAVAAPATLHEASGASSSDAKATRTDASVAAPGGTRPIL
jgi:hypothetical protein